MEAIKAQYKHSIDFVISDKTIQVSKGGLLQQPSVLIPLPMQISHAHCQGLI
jgi:hypothetical protein